MQHIRPTPCPRKASNVCGRSSRPCCPSLPAGHSKRHSCAGAPVSRNASRGRDRAEGAADTDDAEWLFCEYPSLPGLLIASGDSGHSFVTIPWVGNEVADMLEGEVPRFATSHADSLDSALQGKGSSLVLAPGTRRPERTRSGWAPDKQGWGKR